jgi:hypothetical protein
MNAWKKTISLKIRLSTHGIDLSHDEVNTLRRAELTLQRWGELKCGDANEYASWGVERDETTGKPFMVRHANSGKSSRWAVPDREAGALRRIKKLCDAHGLHFYHQTDPRGCALYVAREPILDNNYSSVAVACCD